MLLKVITHHRKNDKAIPVEKGFIELPSGVKKRIITTKGWDLEVKWEDEHHRGYL